MKTNIYFREAKRKKVDKTFVDVLEFRQLQSSTIMDHDDVIDLVRNEGFKPHENRVMLTYS